MNFYKHHIGDFDADTSHLTWIEDMAYTRLMRLYYRREQPIPSDISQACRLVRATQKQEKEAVESVLGEFFTLESDGWHNRRCDAEIAEANAKAEKNRESGRKGGRPRKAANPIETETDTKTKADANQIETETDTKTKADANQIETETKANGFENESEKNPSQTPDSRLQTSTPSSEVALTPAPTPSRLPQSENATRQGALSRKLRTLGIDAAPHLQAWATLLPAYSDEEIIAAAQRVREQKPGERIHLNYLVPVLADRQTPRSQSHDRNADRAATIAAFTGSANPSRRSEPEAIDGTATRIA